MRRALLALLLLLAACTAQQPADPAVTQRIEHICMASGFFHVVNGVLSIAYPVPARILDLGIDKVCMNPEKFAGDVSTVEWLLRNLPHGAQL